MMRTKLLSIALGAGLILSTGGTASAQVASPPGGGCGGEFPPTVGFGGADPSRTNDLSAVAAAQRALVEFYNFTNCNYSIMGYQNARVAREVLGNAQSNWLDQTLALARGHLIGGYRNMNWIPGLGWCHCAVPGTYSPDTPGAPS